MAQRRGQDVDCLECGQSFYQKPACKTARAKKFCCRVCYRSYAAKRFDRYVANPESMALPQCYDEFLDRDELRCLIEGCDWHGLHLSIHMNQTHGIRADELKRAAGFNLGTGVVARPLAERLQARSLRGVGVLRDLDAWMLGQAVLQQKGYIRYKSLEGREHQYKARALLSGPGPERQCKGCGKVFQQTSVFGRTLYCTFQCRDYHYAQVRREERNHDPVS